MTTDKQTLVGQLSDELILELTTRMVEIPTRNPPGDERPCAEFIHATLQGWGIETELIPEPYPERPQVVARIRGTGDGPTVILNGHMDVVSEGDPSAWTRPPFKATREGDRLYGRGTADMKGSVAGAMAVMKALHDAGAQFPGTLMFQAVIGEEMDEEGTRTLLRKGYIGDYAMVLEPTDSRIGPGTRGACWHRIVVTGPSVHCGLAEPDAADVMRFIARFDSELSTYHDRVSAREHHLLASPACRITSIEGGDRHNATVARCELTVDRRMLPDETNEQITEDLRAMLESARTHVPGVKYSVEFLADNEATETPLDSPLVRALQDNSRELTGQQAAIWGPPYGSDMRNFVVDRGIPAVNFGAGDYTVCHQPDEFVLIPDLVNCARVVMGTAIDLLEGRY